MLRAIVSFGILVILLGMIELPNLMRAIMQVHFSAVGLCLVVIGVGVCLSVYKWQGFLRVHGIRSSFWKLVCLYLVGSFFNNFLPTSVGGDVVRASLLCQEQEPTAEVVASVLAERLFGFLVVCLYGTAGIFILPVLAETFRIPLVILIIISLIVCSLLCLNWIRQKLWGVLSSRAGLVLERFLLCLAQYLHHPRVLVRAVWTSAVFQLLVGATYYLVAREMQLQIGFGVMTVMVSLVTLLTLIPISLNGIGVREGGFVLFLGYVGIEESAAIALSLTVYAIVLGFSLLGWFIFLLWKRQGSTA
jgi:uncharacterized protein (TIRG00374 family)